jgi:hypothetical protein
LFFQKLWDSILANCPTHTILCMWWITPWSRKAPCPTSPSNSKSTSAWPAVSSGHGPWAGSLFRPKQFNWRVDHYLSKVFQHYNSSNHFKKSSSYPILFLPQKNNWKTKRYNGKIKQHICSQILLLYYVAYYIKDMQRSPEFQVLPF